MGMSSIFEKLLDDIPDETIEEILGDISDCDDFRGQVAYELERAVGNSKHPSSRAIVVLQESLGSALKRQKKAVEILTSKGEPSKLILQVLDLFEG